MEQVKRLFDIPRYQLNHYPKSDCLTAKINGEWVPTGTAEFLDKAMKISKGLIKLGIQPGDKVALVVAANRPEWNIMDIGILQTGAIVVPLYATICEDDYRYIMNDAGIKLCVVSDEELLKKVQDVKHDVPTLERVYSFEPVEGCAHWEEIMTEGKDVEDRTVEQLMASVKSEDLATLIYTSGTTGTPKGVMLSHNNLVSNALACIPRLPVDHNARSITFLPVCHVYERMLHYLYMITGVSIYYAESMDTIGDNIREVQPNVFTAVPRLLEKVYDKIVDKGKALTGIKRALFFWALDLGLRYELNGANGWWYECKRSIANKLIFSKWREALGGRVQAIASGSAALQPRLARVFNAAGIPVFEGYGLTETSPVISVNAASSGMMFGSVGKCIDKVSVKIAEDGEILVKGPNVMMGYYRQPEQTEEIFKDGWLCTGDIGELTEDGFLRITDRKKEIFKTSGGKYIAPQQMENTFKESGFIEQLMVIGEGEKHPAAIIAPAFDFLKEWCRRHQIETVSPEEMIKNERVLTRFQKEVDKLNRDFGHWEQIKKFRLVADTWSVESGELTPTLKLKRKVIMKKYSALVAEIYGRE